MPESRPFSKSVGQVLLDEYGLRQGSCFPACLLDEPARRDWAGYRSDTGLREKPLKQKALLVVVSQDCDIACHDDRQDPCVELAVFEPIRPKNRHAGNQFAHSVRQLQLTIEESVYEAKVRYTIRVPKKVIEEALRECREELFRLSPEQCRILVLWRANRYQRAALPDRFNEAFVPLLNEALPAIEQAGQDPDDVSRSFIRSLYVYLDNMSEEGPCRFSLLALLRADTPDETQSAIDDALDELCQALEQTPTFTLSDATGLAGLAEKETTLTVAVLKQYVKLNLDHVSLRHGDPDTGH